MDDVMEPFPTEDEFDIVFEKLKRRKEKKGEKVVFDNEGIAKILNGIEKLRRKAQKDEESPKDDEAPLRLIKYSEKSFALIGEGTRKIKDHLLKLGKWNKGLKVKGTAVGGYIFSLKKTRDVLSLLKEKEIEYTIKGFGKVQAQQRNDDRYWCSETFFVFERKDDSDGTVIGTATGLEEKVKKLTDADKYFCDVLGFEY